MLDASSTINYSAGQIRANNAIIALGAAGDVLVFCGQGNRHGRRRYRREGLLPV